MTEQVGLDRRAVLITERAASRIAKIASSEPAGTFLRIAVSGGGCSGFQYSFTLDSSGQEDDRRFQRDGASVAIDDASLDLIAGAELDFREDLSGSAFVIQNPQAASTCGCGMSFSLA